jgi:NADH-quinone oxidoreductase subunit J
MTPHLPQPLQLEIAAATPLGGFWAILLPVCLAFVAVYLLLPRPRSYPPFLGALTAGLAALSVGWLLIRGGITNAEAVLFYAFSLVAVVSGGLLITQRNPVRAALSFALVVLSTCGLFLLQAAPFLMAATIIIYAGAIIVTFIFVIMLAQQTGMSDADLRSREPLLACVAGFVLLGAILFMLNLMFSAGDLESAPALAAASEQAPPKLPADNVGALGWMLFTQYLVPVELGGTLLLVAAIGAIAIASCRAEGLR